MKRKSSRFPAVLLIVLSAAALLVWLVFLFSAFFLGGSPGPDYERSVPYVYAGIMALGFLGAALALIAGIIRLSAKPAKKVLPLCAALLGVLGSMPFFLMDLTAVGLFALIPSILPPLLYLFSARKLSVREE